ncbi:MAG: glycoside-pentoside-hexuronide (GPH):cation symporter [Lachnospiraceae bacterium]|nr:glycoside-pentoside-hexuronide (GPH):cation symporter [Lachnospiraceae bacterium]
MKEKIKPNWLDKNTTAENEVLPRYVKWAWTSRGLALAINALLIMQLTYYCTDMLGMSAGLVGSLLLGSKLFDGVTDVIVGFIIDKTNTRFGKARPYEICIVLVWILTIILFSAPDLSMVGKAIFVLVMYTLINSIFATFLNGGDAVYLSRSIRSQKNRVSVMSFNGTVIMFTSIIISILLPQLIAGIGATKEGWTVIAASFGVPLAIIGLGRFIFVKEVVTESQQEADTYNQRKLSVKESISCIIKNKYIWIFAAMMLVAQFVTNIGTAVNTYYFKYVVGDIGLASVVSLASIVTPIVLMLFPMLSGKFGTVKLIKIGAVMGIVGYAIRFLGGTNMITLLVGSLISGVAIIPITMMGSIYIIDCMDYGEWKTGTRIEGMLNSVVAFSSKVGAGVASGLVGVIMGVAGYNGAMAVQSATAIASIKTLFNIIPLVLMVVMLVLAIMFKIDKEMPRIKADLKKKRG